MSLKTSGDAHHLLFQDYKFNLENTSFFEQIAYLYYSIGSGSRRVTETIRETMRVFTAYPGFKAQYSVIVGKSDESQHAWHTVSEHITFIGEKGLAFATLALSNGPTQQQFSKDAKLLSLLETIQALEHALENKESSVREWWLDYLPGQVEKESERPEFQLATFLYEMRRVLVDAPQNFMGRVWKDGHGKVHLFLTQVNEPEFADERLNVHLTVIHPARFGGMVIEAEKVAA
jgi:hypothetical protein